MSGPDASMVLRCDCTDLGHLIVFDVWHWDTDEVPFSQLLAHMELETHLPIWRRFLLGAQYALTGKTTKWWWTDSVVNDANAAALRDFLNEYLAQSLNAASRTETQRAETTKIGSVEDEGLTAEGGDAQKGQP